MTEIARKLAELGYEPFMDEPKNSEETVAADLKRVGVDVPSDYAAFLEAFPETGSFNRQIGFRGLQPTPWADRSGADRLEILYGHCWDASFDIVGIRDDYRDQVKPPYLIIGRMPGGSQVVMSCAGENRGRIYGWDYEQSPRLGRGLYLAFDDFSSFIHGLFAEEEVPLGDVQFKSDPNKTTSTMPGFAAVLASVMKRFPKK